MEAARCSARRCAAACCRWRCRWRARDRRRHRAGADGNAGRLRRRRYFGLTTFSTGIYKAWLVMNDRIAAAQLAAVLLLVVGALLATERARPSAACASPAAAARRRQRSAAAAAARRRGAGARAAVRLAGAAGFVLPVLWLARMLWRRRCTRSGCAGTLRTVGLASFSLAALAALAATALALALGFCCAQPVRRSPLQPRRACCRWATRCRAR
jgi:ABC-type Fe3+ transport system permease subunit